MRRMVLTSLLMTSSLGCQTAMRAVDTGGEKTRELLGSVEPTGAIAETQERKEAWTAIREGVNRLDVGGFNAAVAELTVTVRKLSELLDALSDERLSAIQTDMAASAAALRLQLEGADVDRTDRSFRALADAITSQVETVDVAAWNALAEELLVTSESLRTSVADIHVSLDRNLAAAGRLTDETTSAIRALPVGAVEESIRRSQATLARLDETSAAIQASASRWPSVTQQVDGTLRSLQLAARIAAGALALWAACAIGWLVRFVRRPA